MPLLNYIFALLLTNCKPITEITKVERKNILQKVTGSLNKNIPATTVPTAPIAPQTAYAVPTGIAFSPPIALKSKNMLKHTQKPKEISQSQKSFPELCCALPKLTAKPVSNNPPTISRIQLILIVLI